MSTPFPVQVASVRGDYRPSAAIRAVPEGLSERFGIEWEQCEQGGLGTTAVAAFRTSNGQFFGLEHLYHLRTLGSHCTSIMTIYQSPEEADVIDDALCAFELSTEDLLWLRDDIHFTPHDLIRQDDHGNQYTAGAYRCRADAMAMMRHLTQGAHKQDYWVRVHEAVAQAALV